MRLVLGLFLAFISASAVAQKIEVFSIPYSSGQPRVGISYEANRPLGRAWLTISVDTAMPDGELNNDFYEQKVEGLRYDASSKKIVFEKDGKLTECARFDRGSFFRTAGWISTDCRLSYKLVKRQIDDGFRISNVDYVVVYLSVAE